MLFNNERNYCVCTSYCRVFLSKQLLFQQLNLRISGHKDYCLYENAIKIDAVQFKLEDNESKIIIHFTINQHYKRAKNEKKI